MRKDWITVLSISGMTASAGPVQSRVLTGSNPGMVAESRVQNGQTRAGIYSAGSKLQIKQQILRQQNQLGKTAGAQQVPAQPDKAKGKLTPPPPGQVGAKSSMVDEGADHLTVLTKELKLTVAQRAAIAPFIEEEKSEAAAIWQKANTQIQKVLGLKQTGTGGVSYFGPFGISGAPSVRSPKWVSFLSDQLAKNLKLTRDQQTLTEPPVVDTQRGLLALHEKTVTRINKVLDPEQRDRFKSLDYLYDPPFYFKANR